MAVNFMTSTSRCGIVAAEIVCPPHERHRQRLMYPEGVSRRFFQWLPLARPLPRGFALELVGRVGHVSEGHPSPTWSSSLRSPPRRLPRNIDFSSMPLLEACCRVYLCEELHVQLFAAPPGHRIRPPELRLFLVTQGSLLLLHVQPRQTP